MREVSLFVVVLASALFLTSCSGAKLEVSEPKKSGIDDADRAIETIRNSFTAMGGIERLRLAGSKGKVSATIDANGTPFPVSFILGGPNRFKLSYGDSEISYYFMNDTCRKDLYGITVRCSNDELQWQVPLFTLQGLVYPAGDAAKLNSTFHMREDAVVEGRNCVVPELRPKKSDLNIKTAYDKTTGLLVKASFYFLKEKNLRENWSVQYSDWREVDKMKVPFERTIAYNDSVIWQEKVESVDFKGYDPVAFDPPLPPAMEYPHPYSLPARRFTVMEIDGQSVEIPAPFATIGGGTIPIGTVQTASSTETMRMVHRGTLESALSLFDTLLNSVSSSGKKAEGSPSIILLEIPSQKTAQVTMIIYVPIN